MKMTHVVALGILAIFTCINTYAGEVKDGYILCEDANGHPVISPLNFVRVDLGDVRINPDGSMIVIAREINSKRLGYSFWSNCKEQKAINSLGVTYYLTCAPGSRLKLFPPVEIDKVTNACYYF